MPRIAELDALRAIAAMAILVFHLDPTAFPVGWTGVDLFFVLSGYLITSIILRHRESPRFLRTFYLRRGLRIWPIYYLVLLTLVAINSLLPRAHPLDGLPYYLLYLQNVPCYWGGTVPPFNEAFDHTWTLAIEEQFYLVWPALLLLAPRRWVIPICLATAALSVVARTGFELYFIFPIRFDPLIERLLLSRCDGFALGGLLAALLHDADWVRRNRRALVAGLSVAFALSACYLVVGYRRGGLGFLGLPTPRRPGLTIFIVEVFYASLVGLVLLHAGRRWLAPLRIRVLTYLGLISYGIYMYHSPIYWAIDGFGVVDTWIYEQPLSTKLLKLGAALAAAVVSWHLIERPVLGLKDRFGYAAARAEPAGGRGP